MDKRGFVFFTLVILISIFSAVSFAQISEAQEGSFDAQGNQVIIQDADGDFVLDNVDDCLSTDNGDSVDIRGCSDEDRFQSFTVQLGEEISTSGDLPPATQFFIAFEDNQHIIYVPDQNGDASIITEGSEVDVGTFDLIVDSIEFIGDEIHYDIYWQEQSAGVGKCATIRLQSYLRIGERTVLSEPRCYESSEGALVIYKRAIICTGLANTGVIIQDNDACLLKSTGATCESDTECQSGTCRGICVELQQDLGGECSNVRPCTAGQCFNGACFKVSALGESCDQNTICQVGGCDASSGTCVPFLSDDTRIELESLYDLSAPGEPFALLSDDFAWVNVYERGRFSFSIEIYNGKILERTRVAHVHPTHVIYADGLQTETVNAVTLRALATSIGFFTSPVQPALTSVVTTSEALGIELPGVVAGLTRFRNARQFLQQLLNSEEVAVYIDMSSNKQGEGYFIEGTVFVDGSVEIVSARGLLSGESTIEPLELDFVNNRASFSVDVPTSGEYEVSIEEVQTLIGTLPSNANAKLVVSDRQLEIQQ